MTHPDITAALARERSRALLAQADAIRRARQASKLVSRGRPVPLSWPARSGSLLAHGLARLRAWPGPARLAGRKDTPAAADLRCHADVHHRDHQAQIARSRLPAARTSAALPGKAVMASPLPVTGSAAATRGITGGRT